MTEIFKGLSAFPITPCDAEGAVDTDNLQSLITRLTDAEVNSIGLLGSTGTYAYLNRAERHRATIAAAEVKHETPLIVGVGALRTDQVITLAQDAEDAGADGLLLAPVSYTPLTQDEAFGHYTAVAARTTLPICIYNNPSTTHFSFGFDLLKRLAELPTIAAVKMPLPAQGTISEDVNQLRTVLPEDFVIGYSGDWGIAEALLAGADAFYSALGGTLPKLFMSLASSAQSGDRMGVTSLDQRLTPLWDLCRQHGSLRLAYALSDRLGLSSAELPRPLMSMGADALRELDIWLSDNADLAR